MLYVTTRNSRDVFTVHHALTKDRADDGGYFLPFHMTPFSSDELTELAQKPMNHRMAMILNRLFGTKLSGWDMDFAVGRRPVRLTELNQRCIIASCWHNPQWDFEWMASQTAALLRNTPEDPRTVEWVDLALRIAVLFGVFGEMPEAQGSLADVAVPSGDLSWAAAAEYARGWGLPVGGIIVSCNENPMLWELLNRGSLPTGELPIVTATPRCDRIHTPALERLIHRCGGEREVQSYLLASESRCDYVPGELTLQNLRSGMFASVISQKRMASVIPNLYRSTGSLLGPYDALAFCGLQDHRSAVGENRRALILSSRSPRLNLDFMAAAMTMTQMQLQQLLEKE